MTYTFKLARRLAVSRTLTRVARALTLQFTMFPVFLLFVACSSDAIGPEGSPSNSATPGVSHDIIPVAVRISPNTVTVETNQLIRFSALGRTSAGDSVGAPVVWSATGGTILPDGRFAAASVGTYQVMGRTHTQGEVLVDTSTIVVVRRQPKLATLDVSPGSVNLTSGTAQRFSAIGRLRNGTSVAIGVNWIATGGAIDAGGTYVAGDTAGTFQVIGTNTAGTIADTAIVTISAPPSPPPPAPPAPQIVKVTLLPATVTLAPAATRQFTAYGSTSAGDSVALQVVFQATGGTVTSSGLYTAGASEGSFRVVATAGALADTSTVSVRLPSGSGSTLGMPFGPFKLWTSSIGTATAGVESFNASIDYTDANLIVRRISAARGKNLKLLLMMTDNGHAPYITAGKFDLAKWKAAMDTYRTAEIRDAVAAGVADGTVLGNSVLDEPNHSDWGGVITKAVVDSMASYVKQIFPTLPAGIVAPYYWRSTERYRVADFLVAQTWKTTLTPTAWRDAATAAANQNGMALILSINLFGAPLVAGCELASGNYGTCIMTAAEVKEWGTAMAQAPGCAALMWRYDSTLMTKPEYVTALKSVAAQMATSPKRSCRRP
jgi:hypothetical protein